VRLCVRVYVCVCARERGRKHARVLALVNERVSGESERV